MRFNQIPNVYLCSGSLRSSLHCHLDTDNDHVLLYNGVIVKARTKPHVGDIEMDLVSEHLRV